MGSVICLLSTYPNNKQFDLAFALTSGNFEWVLVIRPPEQNLCKSNLRTPRTTLKKVQFCELLN